MGVSLDRSLFEGMDRIGVAVSGGSDSVAAFVLMTELLGAERVEAASVDHGLRPEAAQEAQGVGDLCAQLSVRHEILNWDGQHSGNLQDAARRARYERLAAWAQARGLDAVVLGHTQDDQAETVLLRLARGSGVDGLAGMATRVERHGILWLRPFLSTSREALRSVLRARGIGWIDDPSNDDTRFARVRARQALDALEPLGIDAQTLADTAGRLARAREVLQNQTHTHLRDLVREDMPGVLRLDPRVFDLPGEYRDRLFAELVRNVSGSIYRPRLKDLHRFIKARSGTLAGCQMIDGIWMFREASAVANIAVPTDEIWEDRWTATGAGEPAHIRHVGDEGLRHLSQQAKDGLHPHWRDLGVPMQALKALPGIWREDALIAAPLHLWPNGWDLHARPLAAFDTEIA